MTLDEECRLSYYERIATLNKAHGVFLVQHTENHRIYVEKNLTVYDVRIYQYRDMLPPPMLRIEAGASRSSTPTSTVSTG